MQANLKTSSTPMKRLRAVVGGVLAAALMLSVPVLSVSAVASWGGSASSQQPAIESADDAVHNGFRIVKKESAGMVRSNSRAAFADQPAETVLREWQFTRDKTGSPGQ